MSELRDRIKEIIDTEDVVVFMKGTPRWAMCGNSMRALEALRAVEAPIAAVDILPNPEYRKELSAVSGWPTIPQVFVKGELIGGADIVQELVVSGELQRKLVDALGEDYRTSGDERTLALATATT
jgi:monothiol glutaredoxin